MAEETVLRHVLDQSVSKDYVGEGGLSYLLHYFRGVGVLEPQAVAVADVAELLAGDCGSQLAEH